jgi:uncharacterized membrane protein
MDLSWREYEQQRRRLNARLGLYILVMIPVPLFLLARGVSPLWMLLLVICAAVGIGVVYPLWWRARHNPDRHQAQEKWAVRVVSVCRSVAVFSAVAAAVAWETLEDKSGSISRSMGVVVFLGVAVACFLCSLHVQDKTRRELRRPHG